MRQRPLYKLILWLLLTLLCGWLASCGGTSGSVAGDASSGQRLFHGKIALPGDAPACNSCHVVKGGEPIILGPNLSNIGNRAAVRVQGQGAAEYLRTSILDPDAHLVDDFQEGIMYREYRQVLSPEQLQDLIAYLLTLKSGDDS